MPKSLFVDPKEVRAAGKVTFNDIPVNQYKKSVKDELKSGKYTKEDLIRIFRDMTVLREFETMLNNIKTQGGYNGIDHTYPGPAHLSIGQEAACVGQAYLLDENDFAFGSHRSHSEILAITAASEYLGGKYLTDCTLYVTVEPCIMCAGALGWSQISRVVYGAPDEKRGFRAFAPKALHPRCEVLGGVLEQECAALMKNFFQKKR